MGKTALAHNSICLKEKTFILNVKHAILLIDKIPQFSPSHILQKDLCRY